MPSGIGGYVPKPPGVGGGNYPAFPALPGMPGAGGMGGALDINAAAGLPSATGGATIPGVPGTLPTAPNLTEIQANPQLQQVFESIFPKMGTADPYLLKNIANIEGRMDADTTGRAISRATSKIQDQLAGHLQANKERALRMGGGGGEEYGAARLTDAAQRAQAGAAADISLGRERDLDALALGAGSAYAAPGNRELGWAGAAGGAAQAVAGNQLGAAGQALQAWQQQQQTQLAQQQLAMQQQMAMLNMYSNLWS